MTTSKTSVPIALSKEDRNMQRLYEACIQHGDLPTIADYNPLGSWLDEGTALYRERISKGVSGSKSYMNALRTRDHTTYTKLLQLVSSGQSTETPEETSPLVGTLLSDVIPKKVIWLWDRRLALGKVTTVDGDPGLGKTTLLFDVGARLTRGRPLPNDDTSPLKGGVVLISIEDGLEDTIQPRLARAGADLTKVVSIAFIDEYDEDNNKNCPRPFSVITDLDVLRAAIKRVNAKLVIIDPVMAVIGSKDTYKDTEVRQALSPLVALAEEMQVAVTLVRHFTKGGGEHAIYRGGGSIAFIGLARTGLMVTKDPGDETMCVLANIKNNLSKPAPSLKYSIVDDSDQSGDTRPYVKWEGVSEFSVQELMSAPTGANRQEILKIMRDKKRPLTPSEVFLSMSEDNPELKQDNVTTTMYRMKQAGQLISPSRGQYSLPPTVM